VPQVGAGAALHVANNYPGQVRWLLQISGVSASHKHSSHKAGQTGQNNANDNRRLLNIVYYLLLHFVILSCRLSLPLPLLLNPPFWPGQYGQLILTWACALFSITRRASDEGNVMQGRHGWILCRNSRLSAQLGGVLP